MKNTLFQVEKQKIDQVNYTESELADLEEGEVRVKMDHFAFTTNNITYAVSGFTLKYWNFFPTQEPYGIIPVWGYADVVSSKHADIRVGDRYYGYYPMARYCTLQPSQVKPHSFSDGAAHRQGLAPIYNNYTRVRTDDILHTEALQVYVPILHPLFSTSFMIYQFFKSQDFRGAEQMMISSASAKTSLGTAYMLRQNQSQDGKKIIGLTSAGNIDFVKSTGYYDDVIAYEDYERIASVKSVLVDIRGNRKFLLDLSHHLKELLVHIAIVGLTDWKAAGTFSDIPKAELFFAPTVLKAFFQEQGAAQAMQMINMASAQFMEDSKKTMELEVIQDIQGLTTLYLDMLQGRVNPKLGYIVRIKE